MKLDGSCVSTVDSPVFVCERCGNIIRVILYSAGDEMACNICGGCMTKTDYVLSDDESYLMYGRTHEALEFQDEIFKRYVRDSKKFDTQAFDSRWKTIKYMSTPHFINTEYL